MTHTPQYQSLLAMERKNLPEYSEVITFKMTDNTDKKVGRIIAKTADICLSALIVDDGLASFTAGVSATLAFLDLEGEKRSISYIGLIDGKIRDESLRKDSIVDLKFDILECSIEKIIGSDITVSLAYEAKGSFINENTYNVFVDLEDAFVEDAEGILTKECGHGEEEFIVEGEMDLNYDVSLVLASSSAVFIDKTEAGNKLAVIEGRVLSRITLQLSREDSEIKTEVLHTPFRVEVGMENSDVDMDGTSSIEICTSNVLVSSDEVKGRSKLEVTVKGRAHATVFEKEDFDYVLDVFSTANELTATRENLNSFCFEGRADLSGEGRLSYRLEEDYVRAISVISASASVASVQREENGVHIDAVACVEVLLENEDGYKNKTFDLPFSIHLSKDFDGTVDFDINLQVERAEAELKLKNELSLYIEAKGVVDIFEKKVYPIITSLEIGEQKIEDGSAICVYIAEGGEGLIDIAKALNAMPSELTIQNGELSYPLKKGEKVLFYRQRKG